MPQVNFMEKVIAASRGRGGDLPNRKNILDQHSPQKIQKDLIILGP